MPNVKDKVVTMSKKTCSSVVVALVKDGLSAQQLQSTPQDSQEVVCLIREELIDEAREASIFCDGPCNLWIHRVVLASARQPLKLHLSLVSFFVGTLVNYLAVRGN